VLLTRRIELPEALRKSSPVGIPTDSVLEVVAVAEVSAVVVVAIVLHWISCLRTVIADISDTIPIEVHLVLVRNLDAVVVFIGNAVTVSPSPSIGKIAL
jgi:hypothetical protein